MTPLKTQFPWEGGRERGTEGRRDGKGTGPRSCGQLMGTGQALTGRGGGGVVSPRQYFLCDLE